VGSVLVHISRILSGLPPDDHIPRMFVTKHLLRLSEHNKTMLGTALHAGKDLAVSPLMLP